MRISPASFSRSGLALVVMLVLAIVLAGGRITPVLAAPSVGQPAPLFTGTDSRGRMVSLADYRGRIVVLEWTNHECPFVRRHYESGHMQALQRQATGGGVVWLSVISSAPGEQGSVTGDEANALTRERGAAPTAVILDPDGHIGHAYDAKTTPEMFVIDRSGTLVYAGAIDNQQRNFGADPAKADNYVADALQALKRGRPVATSVTRPYGCSVKYRSGT